MIVGMLVLVLLIVALVARMGGTVNAPSWIQAELATRVEGSLGDAARLRFGDIALVVNKGWRPRVRLQDLVLSRADGQELLRLSDAEVSFSVRALAQGEIRPKKVLLTGVFATLRRGADGAVALTLGDTGQPLEEAPDLPALIESLDVALQQPMLRSMSALEIEALTLRYEDLRAGRAWTVDGGQVLAQRSGHDLRVSGSVSLLSGRAYASTIEVNYASRIGDRAAEFGFSVHDIAAEDIAVQNVALNWLEVLRAPISGALRGSILQDGALGPLNATLQIGKGVLQPTDSTRPIPFDVARSYFTYVPDQQKLIFDELSVVSSWASGVAEGSAYLGGVENGQLTDLIGQFSLNGFRVNPDGLYAEPLVIGKASADFRLNLDPFQVDLGQLQVTDKNSTLLMSGHLLAASDGWNVSLDGAMDRLTPERLLELWPERAAVKPRKWVADNMLEGMLTGINLALRSVPGQDHETYLDFGFDDASVQITKWLPPLTGASGTATLVKNRFVTTASAGVIDSGGHGIVDASGTSFIMPDVRVKPDTPGIARITVDGPVAAVVALLNRPPLSILKGSKLPVDLAEGRVRATGTIALPLKPGNTMDDTEFHVTGVIRDVESTVLVPGYRLTAEAMKIDVDNDRVILTGNGRIGDLPVVAEWRQPLGPPGSAKTSRLTGQVELSERAVETFNLGLPPGSIAGTGQADFVIDLGAGAPPVLALQSDLAGVRLAIPSLGWAKPPVATGSLDLTATLGAQAQVDRMELRAAGLAAVGQVTTRPGGGLDRASFSSVQIGGWLDAPVDIVGNGAGAPIGLQIRGGKLDLGRATFGAGGGETGAISVALDRLQITQTIALSDFAGRFTTSGGMQGAFTGRLGGNTPVSGEVVPQDGRSAFRILAADAGGVLRDSGLLTQARGGDFTMTLVPVDGPGNYDGSARIRNTRVINAPAIAALLDAVSIVGLIDELAGPGIQFAQVNARFRLSPDRVVLYESSAVGPSIGLSMDGEYDIGDDLLKMQGVISPIYLINGIGAVLTRKGEGLIGFNYTLQGAATDPKVQVNPLSALTPGMLRDVFRAPPPKNPNAPEPGSARPNRGAPDPSDGSTGGR